MAQLGARIEIRVKAPGVNRLVAAFRKAVRRGATSLSRRSIRNIAQIVADRNRKGFDEVARTGRRISMYHAVFTRRRNGIKGRNATVGIIIAQTNNIKPLQDTNRLMRSFTEPAHREFKVEVGRRGIRIKSLVPYGSRHLRGGQDSFKFGRTEKKRLRNRVPPPPKKGEGKTNRTEVARRNNRAFYRLRSIARDRYPTSARIPKRDYIRNLTDADTARINLIIANDLRRAIERRRR